MFDRTVTELDLSKITGSGYVFYSCAFHWEGLNAASFGETGIINGMMQMLKRSALCLYGMYKEYRLEICSYKKQEGKEKL